MTTPTVFNAADSVRSIAGASVLAHALIDILRRESRALAVMTFEVPNGFIEAKCRLIAAYTNKIEVVSRIPEVPETISALGELHMLNVEVLAAARHNALQIQGAIDGHRVLVATIAGQGPRPVACLSPIAGHC